MDDNEYTLDMILQEAKRLRGAKGEEEGGPAGEGYRPAGYSERDEDTFAPKDRFMIVDDNPSRLRERPALRREPQSYPRPEQEPEKPSPGEEYAAAQESPRRETRPAAPSGFRISRESAVFGSYRSEREPAVSAEPDTAPELPREENEARRREPGVPNLDLRGWDNEPEPAALDTRKPYGHRGGADTEQTAPRSEEERQYREDPSRREATYGATYSEPEKPAPRPDGRQPQEEQVEQEDYPREVTRHPMEPPSGVQYDTQAQPPRNTPRPVEPQNPAPEGYGEQAAYASPPRNTPSPVEPQEPIPASYDEQAAQEDAGPIEPYPIAANGQSPARGTEFSDNVSPAENYGGNDLTDGLPSGLYSDERQADPNTGFRLRRDMRRPEASVELQTESASDRTRQFDTQQPDMEAAGELALPLYPPAGAGGRWQAYRMMEEEEEDDERPEERHPNGIDLDTPEDFVRVRQRVQAHTVFAVLRFIALTLTGAAGIYLVLSQIATVLPVPEYFNSRTAPGMFAMVLALITLTAVLCSIVPVGRGLLSLLRMRADGGSMTAVAAVTAIIYTFALALQPQLLHNENAQLYCVIPLVGLWFQAAARLMALSRIRHNLSVLASDEQLHGILLSEDDGFAGELAPLLEDHEPKIAVQVPVGFLQGLLYHSDERSEQESGASRVLAPICFAAAAALAVSSYFLYRDILTCFTVFLAVLCVCAPFTALFNENLPLMRAAKSLTPLGAVITGAKSAEELADAAAVTVDAADLFADGGITLHGIRTFKNGRIDVAILAAASVMERVNGTMTDVFSQIIEGRKEILEDVDNIVYEDGMGVSAWVNGEHVLIGSRELMRHHGIELPSREYELKYMQGERSLLYLAVAGELSSMFVITYNPNQPISDVLYHLTRARVTVMVRTTDPNITREMLADLFELDYDMVQVLPAALHNPYEKLTARRPLGQATAATMGGVMSYLRALEASLHIRSAGSLSLGIQTLFIVAGYAMTTILTFFFGISLINPLLLLSYQLLAALGAMLALSLRRY